MLITTNTQLSDFLRTIETETELAIDTEFRRINTYRPILCLLQIATKQTAVCIDILAFDDLTPLFDKLYHPDTLWIVHASTQDIEAIYQHSGQFPKRLFDTQIAASLLNYPAQISYQALTQSLQQVHLPKAYTRLDWTTRPLPLEAIEYALDDVRYLRKNYHTLRAQLSTEQKSTWMAEESRTLLARVTCPLDIHQTWQKVRGFKNLPKTKRTLGAQLSAWREQQAQQRNKPRRWIMSDEQLINYALDLQKLSAKSQAKFSDFLTQHPELAQLTPAIIAHKPPTPSEKSRQAELQKLIAQKANQYNLQPEIIASNKTLLHYAQGKRALNMCQGWRATLLSKDTPYAK